jgi:hypothetical protein
VQPSGPNVQNAAQWWPTVGGLRASTLMVHMLLLMLKDNKAGDLFMVYFMDCMPDDLRALLSLKEYDNPKDLAPVARATILPRPADVASTWRPLVKGQPLQGPPVPVVEKISSIFWSSSA